MRRQVVPHSQRALDHVEAHRASELDRSVEMDAAVLVRFLARPRVFKAEKQETDNARGTGQKYVTR